MFPNGRLVIVAMLASVVAVSCGLGVFAAFRVNHQPFTRLQSADPPLQLVFGSGAPAPVRDVSAAPFGVRFLLNVPVAVPETVSVVSIQREPGPVADPAVPAPQPEPAAADAPSAVPADAQAAAVSADQDASQQASEQAAKENEPAVGQETTPDDKTGGAADVALASLSDQTPAADPTLQDTTQPAATKRRIARGRKPTVKATANAAPERRVVRHFRRTRPIAAAPSAMQGFAPGLANQAVWGTATQAPQVRGRLVVKRHRSANKTAAQAPAGNQTPANGAAAQAPASNQTAANGPALATSKQ
jgi:hypothetical protein